MFAALNSFLTRAVSGYFLNKSLRFRSSASAYLNRTPATATNQKTWTWSGWVKRGTLGTTQNLATVANTGSSLYFYLRFLSTDVLEVFTYNSAGSVFVWQLQTTQVFRDPAAWYHIVVATDTTQGTAANRVKIYVNGSQITSFAIATYPSASYDTVYNFNGASYVTSYLGAANFYDGELAELNSVDGLALAPTAFGAYSIYNQWLPIKYAGTYGTNGFYLPFSTGTDTSSVSVNYLVVAGGGGGGVYGGGGGGAGGYRTGTLSVSPSTPYTVTVGLGGAGAVAFTAKGVSGGGSTFSSITSAGGGGGGSDEGTATNNGADGGSGGGASLSYNQAWAGGASSPVTSPVQGYAGGGVANLGAFFNGGGGGGGAGAVGGTGSSVAAGGGYGNAGYGTAGNGGAGAASSISGSSVTYAGGGGSGGASTGAAFPNSYYIAAGSGGSGGGGAGTDNNSVGVAGTANLGGGGGGGGMYAGGITGGGAGGSGVVIISYAGAQKFSGGTVTTSGGNTIHTFTASGFLTSVFNDASGNANNWTPNNISLTAGSTYDSLTDVPTLTSTTVANYCVLNAISGYSGLPLTAANIQTSAVPSGADWYSRSATMGISNGKWYTEFSMPSITSGAQGNPVGVGIIPASNDFSAAGQMVGNSGRGYGFYCPDTTGSSPQKRVSGSSTSVGTGTATTTSDVFMVAFDLTNGNAWFGKNGTWYAGDPSAGTGASITGITAGEYVFGLSVYRDGTYTNNTVAINFGQRPFAYPTLPSGFLPLNTFNI